MHHLAHCQTCSRRRLPARSLPPLCRRLATGISSDSGGQVPSRPRCVYPAALRHFYPLSAFYFARTIISDGPGTAEAHTARPQSVAGICSIMFSARDCFRVCASHSKRILHLSVLFFCDSPQRLLNISSPRRLCTDCGQKRGEHRTGGRTIECASSARAGAPSDSGRYALVHATRSPCVRARGSYSA